MIKIPESNIETALGIHKDGVEGWVDDGLRFYIDLLGAFLKKKYIAISKEELGTTYGLLDIDSLSSFFKVILKNKKASTKAAALVKFLKGKSNNSILLDRY